MLTVEEVKALPIGKGILVRSLKAGTSYHALITPPMFEKEKETLLRLVTDGGRLSRPLYQNYGKSWVVEAAI